jgi:hypothetical protein
LQCEGLFANQRCICSLVTISLGKEGKYYRINLLVCSALFLSILTNPVYSSKYEKLARILCVESDKLLGVFIGISVSFEGITAVRVN